MSGPRAGSGRARGCASPGSSARAARARRRRSGHASRASPRIGVAALDVLDLDDLGAPVGRGGPTPRARTCARRPRGCARPPWGGACSCDGPSGIRTQSQLRTGRIRQACHSDLARGPDSLASTKHRGGLDRADVGVFGGSGFYAFLPDAVEAHVTTEWGGPSAPGHGRHDRGPAGRLRAAPWPPSRTSRPTGSTTAERGGHAGARGPGAHCSVRSRLPAAGAAARRLRRGRPVRRSHTGEGRHLPRPLPRRPRAPVSLAEPYDGRLREGCSSPPTAMPRA